MTPASINYHKRQHEPFEMNEYKQFGADGFELYRDKAAGLQKEPGIYDLTQFIPAH
jgi:hypothetical protein